MQTPAAPATGQLPAEALAKAYLWLSATVKRSATAEDRASAAALLEKLQVIMPETWQPNLDAKVTRHLAEHGATE